jgi:Ca-activated chloride channel homolog
MNLLSQWLWLGLLTLPAILVLHLLRERSRRQPISSLELWRWLEKELRGPRLRRLPVTWILLLQLLAALGLNVALSRPQFSWAQLLPARQHLILVVDTSSSMAARDVPPTRLAQAQAAAGARLAALGETDRATIISAGPAARQLASADAGSLNDLAGRLASLQAGGDGSDWAGALALAAAAIEPDLTNRILVYTDGAFEMSSAIEAVSFPAEVELHLVGQPQSNQAVVNLAVRPSASGAVQVFARVANFADAPVERALTLTADGNARDQLVVSLPPSGVSDQAWTLPPGVRTVAVALASADVLPADDTAAVGVLGSSTLRGVR